MTPTGISGNTAIHDARLALYAAVKTALENENGIDIQFGLDWPVAQDDWVAVTDAESEIDPKIIGPSRQQDERITLSLSVGSWRQGNDSATEILAADRAFAILKRIQDHIRRKDITLGGTVLWCIPGGSRTAGATTETESAYGRITEITATFVCSHRIKTI